MNRAKLLMLYVSDSLKSLSHKNHSFKNQTTPIVLYAFDLLKRTHKSHLFANWKIHSTILHLMSEKYK